MLKVIPSKPNVIVVPKDVKVIKAIRTTIPEGKTIEGFMVYKMLVIMNHQGLLPKGYLTRVRNGHISFKTALKKIVSIKNETNFTYNIISKSLGNNQYAVILCKTVA